MIYHLFKNIYIFPLNKIPVSLNTFIEKLIKSYPISTIVFVLKRKKIVNISKNNPT